MKLKLAKSTKLLGVLVGVLVLKLWILSLDLSFNNQIIGFGLSTTTALLALVYLLWPASLLQRLVLLVLLMLAFTLLLVPLYNVFCDVTGLNGKMDLSKEFVLPADIKLKPEDLEREITVEFDVNHHQAMPWIFRPKHKTMRLKVGEVAKTAYYAKNPSNYTIVAQAIPSIAPTKASAHLKKVKCFCFTKLTLGPGEVKHFILHFYLDPKLPKDVKRLTLSYTLFDITDKVNN